MGRNDSQKATDAELEILNILWHTGSSTVRDIHDILTKLRDIHYTTTLKTLQVMKGKGLVKRNESQKAHIYEAAVDREETQLFLVGDLVDKIFNGSAADFVAGALSAKKASPEDLAKIRQLLDKAERGEQ